MSERTLAIIKPDAVASGFTGPIINLIELNKFKIVGMRKEQLSEAQVKEFYAVHASRSFFQELVDYMLSGPVVLMALESENAVSKWRDLMGATDPKKAAPGTIRYMYGASIGSNATHGSDSAENAKTELSFFFKQL